MRKAFTFISRFVNWKCCSPIASIFAGSTKISNTASPWISEIFFYPASVAESFRWIRKRNMHWCLFQLYCTESRCICVNNRAKELRQVVSFCIFKQMQTQKQNHAHQWHGAQSAEIIMRSDWIFLYLCLSCSSFVSRFSVHLYLVIWCWCFEICDTHSFEYAQQ